MKISIINGGGVVSGVTGTKAVVGKLGAGLGGRVGGDEGIGGCGDKDKGGGVEQGVGRSQ